MQEREEASWRKQDLDPGGRGNGLPMGIESRIASNTSIGNNGDGVRKDANFDSFISTEDLSACF